MKKLISLVLMLALVLSFSASAFAVRDIEVEVPKEDSDLAKIGMPDDVSADKEDVSIDFLALIPEPLKKPAREQIAHVRKLGYTIYSGFGAWTESKDLTYCTIKLSLKDIPDRGEIFVNGNQIQPETKANDGYCTFDVPLETTPLKSVVLIVIPPKTPIAPEPYYPSVGSDAP